MDYKDYLRLLDDYEIICGIYSINDKMEVYIESNNTSGVTYPVECIGDISKALTEYLLGCVETEKFMQNFGKDKEEE